MCHQTALSQQLQYMKQVLYLYQKLVIIKLDWSGLQLAYPLDCPKVLTTCGTTICISLKISMLLTFLCSTLLTKRPSTFVEKVRATKAHASFLLNFSCHQNSKQFILLNRVWHARFNNIMLEYHKVCLLTAKPMLILSTPNRPFSSMFRTRHNCEEYH